MADAVEKRRLAVGEKNGASKLLDREIDQLKRLRAEGWKHKMLSKKFGISECQVGRILRGESR